MDIDAQSFFSLIDNPYAPFREIGLYDQIKPVSLEHE